MSSNSIISGRKKRWHDFMAGEKSTKNMIMISYLGGLKQKPYIQDGKYEDTSDWIVEKYHIMRENLNWLADDSIPYLDMLTGTEIFAEAFGCKVTYPTSQKPIAMHKIHDISEISSLKIPNMWDTKLANLFDMAHKLRQKTEKDAVIRLPDIQSPLDIAALIMNKEEFYIGIMDDPEPIQELIAKAYTLLTQFIDEWFKAFGREFVAHFPDYYMEYGITLSEDEIGIISAKLFDEFFLSELNRLSDRYGRIGIHCCANARHQWDSIKTIHNLSVLNLEQPREIVKEAYPFYKDVCAQTHKSYGEGEISTWKSQMPEGARVIYRLFADNKEDALMKLEELRKL